MPPTPEKRKLYLKEYYQKNIEYLRKRNREWKQRHKDYYYLLETKFRHAKHASKRKNKEWVLTFEEYSLLINKPCYYCGTSLTQFCGIGLDRIDNELGYLISNVLPCCGPCNYVRADRFTVEETKVMIDALLKFRKEKK